MQRTLDLPFTYGGITITDPNMDETGRFPVDWRTYWKGEPMHERTDWADFDFPPDVELPHVHRCVDCGGFIIRPDLDNTNCVFCTTTERARCSQCNAEYCQDSRLVDAP